MGKRWAQKRSDADVLLRLHDTVPFGQRMWTSLLLYGLLLEWIWPWTRGAHGEVIRSAPLLLAVLGFTVGELFRFRAVAAFVWNLLVVMAAVMQLYRPEGQSMLNWLVNSPTRLIDQIIQLSDGGMWLMSGELRAFILLAGWALLVPALQLIIWARQFAHGLGIVTIVYLLMLHEWIGMDTQWGLMRAALEWLLLAAAVTLARVHRVYGQGADHGYIGWSAGWRSSWAGGAAIIVVIAACAALLGISNRTWADKPANWTTAWTDQWNGTIRQLADRYAAQTANAREESRSTGYGFDDSKLGASLGSNASVRFTVQSDRAMYWRGTSRSVYTGQGWADSPMAWMSISLGQKAGESAAGHAGDAVREGNAAGERGSDFAAQQGMTEAEELQSAAVTQTIQLAEPEAGLPLFIGGANATIKELVADAPSRQLFRYWQDAATGTFFPPGDNLKISSYTVEAQPPIDGDALGERLKAVEALKGAGADEGASEGTSESGKASGSASESSSDGGSGSSSERANAIAGDAVSKGTSAADGSEDERIGSLVAEGQGSSVAKSPGDPAEIIAEYTQLPDSLPARVGELAAKIMKDSAEDTADASRYAKVTAIESYLKTHYAYTLQGSKVPPTGADFVDDFLFEQRQGYCVHFSTAMVVMLRTQGIPARWVKGYAPGERTVMPSNSAGGVTTAEAGIGGAGLLLSGGDGEARAADGEIHTKLSERVRGTVGKGVNESLRLSNISLENAALTAEGESARSVSEASSGERSTFVVRDSDAHAWVEVYFAGVGWVSFEPTPGFAGAAAASLSAADAVGIAPGQHAGPEAASSRAVLPSSAPAWAKAAAAQAAEAIARVGDALAQAWRQAAGGASAGG
ncbi:transglutaminase domain protein, partial [Paenibacillus curdlanolyticus YK9]